jgi:Domain of unknown function (DUF5069)
VLPRKIEYSTTARTTSPRQPQPHKTMLNSAKDLSKEPPRSPRVRLGRYLLAARMIDKGRASLNSSLGKYHFDCTLDNILLKFKGITAQEILSVLETGASDDEVIEWMNAHGTPRTEEEIKAWTEAVLTERALFFNFLEADDTTHLSPPPSSLRIPAKGKS